MGSTDTLERIELDTVVVPVFKCQLVWIWVVSDQIKGECGEPAEYLATLHANGNSKVREHIHMSRYVCQACLTKVSHQFCEMHQTGILLGYTKL